MLIEFMISNFETHDVVDPLTGAVTTKNHYTSFQWLKNILTPVYPDPTEPYVLHFIFSTFGKPNEPSGLIKQIEVDCLLILTPYLVQYQTHQ